MRINYFHKNITEIGFRDKFLYNLLYNFLYRSERLSLRDMLSLGAWRMGLGCSGKIIPPSSSPPSSSSPNRFSILWTFLHTFAHCSILRVCHEWGPYKRWGAARHVKRSGISIRTYLVLTNIANIIKYSPQCSILFENLIRNVQNARKS